MGKHGPRIKIKQGSTEFGSVEVFKSDEKDYKFSDIEDVDGLKKKSVSKDLYKYAVGFGVYGRDEIINFRYNATTETWDELQTKFNQYLQSLKDSKYDYEEVANAEWDARH